MAFSCVSAFPALNCRCQVPTITDQGACLSKEQRPAECASSLQSTEICSMCLLTV